MEPEKHSEQNEMLAASHFLIPSLLYRTRKAKCTDLNKFYALKICDLYHQKVPTLDLLCSYETANQNAGKLSLIKNISSKKFGSECVFSLSCKPYSVICK